jgi:nucleoside-diphosphate-sugar epimerase/sugar phosphate isomerase/epimerase
MSTGSAAIPLLKAAARPEQLRERLADGDWAGVEVCLLPSDVAGDEALDAAIEAVRSTCEGRTVLAEAPVAWPSGAHVRVDRLDDEAIDGIERSARFAAAVGSPVLTIHLFCPQDPATFRAEGEVDERAVERFLRAFAEACLGAGVEPLLENVPPVLRMRTGGVFLSPVGGHWRDLLAWRERIPELAFTFDTSHAALFRHFAGAYPSLFGLEDDEGLELDRWVAELGPALRVAHVSNARGILGEGTPYDDGEEDLDGVVGRLSRTAGFVVAEINEPDPASSGLMKAAYRAIERAARAPVQPWSRPGRRLRDEGFDWQRVVGRDPVPAVLELADRVEGRRVVVTGGAGSIGRRLTSLLAAFRPELITVVDHHEAALTADRRTRPPELLSHFEHVLCDVRDRERVDEELRRARPDLVFHLAAYKHVDWAERYPAEFASTNLDGSWNVLRAADEAGASAVVVASTDKAARASSRYGRTKRLMEALTALSAQRTGADRAAVRLVNVLGSAGSASELFLRQSRAGIPLTVTDGAMLRFWITHAHAASMLAHAVLCAAQGATLVTAADPPELSVGELAERIWRMAGPGGETAIRTIGRRPGETQEEVLVGPGETLGPELFQGTAAIEGSLPLADPGPLAEAADAAPDADARRRAWLAAMDA